MHVSFLFPAAFGAGALILSLAAPRMGFEGADSDLAQVRPQAPSDDHPKWAAVPPSGGRLERERGTMILYLTGDSVEARGFAEGYLLADEIMACFTEFALGHVTGGRPLLWDVLLRTVIQTKFAFGDEDRRWAEAVVLGMQRAREEGIELGRPDRDIDALDILACAAIPDLAGFLCSSLAAWGEASADGDVLVARNLDYPSTPAIESFSMIEVHAPLDGQAGWVGVGWPGSRGCLTGLSDRGVYVALHDVGVNESMPEARATPRAVVLERMLTELRVSPQIGSEAVALAREHAFTMGGNGMVAWQSEEPDARGAVVLEIGTDPDLDGGVTLRAAAADETWIACSNHHRARSSTAPTCGRYSALAVGGTHGAVGTDRAWELAEEAGMSITLYRTVADLGASTLAIERQTGDGWQPRVTIDAKGAVR